MRTAQLRQGLRRHPLTAVIVLALAGSPFAAAHADSWPVTSCADDGSSGTLRSQLALAHDGDTIDMTQLTCGTITLAQGQLVVEDVNSLTLAGPGQDRLKISGGGASPILTVDFCYDCHYNDLTLRDLTVAHGRAGPDTPYDPAGCLANVHGSLVLERVTVTDCHAYDLWRTGGAVYAGGLTMIDSTVSHSSVTGTGGVRGGGVDAGGALLIRSSITGNSAVGTIGGYLTGGGGLFTGRLVMIDSVVSGNTSKATNNGWDLPGGGVYAGGDTLILRSLIADNGADGDGGGLFTGNVNSIFFNSFSFTIQDSTIAYNTAAGVGGGVASDWPVSIANSTIAGNTSASGGAVRLNLYRRDSYGNRFVRGWPDFEGTIIGGNFAGAGAAYATDLSIDAPVTVFGAHNLIGDADASITLPPRTLRGDPQLNPLADNGGRSMTMAPMDGSPVIDAGFNPLAFNVDQRGPGFARTYGVAADIGAYEVQPPPAPGSVEPTPVAQARVVADRPPTVLPVTSCADDGSPGTLRAVAAEAIDGDTIDMSGLACSKITLAQGPVGIGVFGPNALHYLTINGPGKDALTISGNDASAVFLLGGPSNYRIKGTVTLSNLAIADGAKYDSAACIAGFSTYLVLDDVGVTGCHTLTAGGGTSWNGHGGGAVSGFNVQALDSTIGNSGVTAIDRNVASGGGLWAYSATLTRSTISGNSASAPMADAEQGYQTAGGGVYTAGRLYVIDSTISGNAVEATEPYQDGNGGGVAAMSVFTISGSTISGNSADGIGGGAIGSLSNYHPPLAALPTEALGILNSTFTGNSAGLAGAFADANALPVANSTIASNTSRYGGAVGILWSGTYDYSYTLYLDSTIIANNRIDGPGGHAADLATSPNLTLTVTGSNNLVGTADPNVTLPPDTILGVDPQLLPLAGNGGATWTMALAPGSPAIDAGSNPRAFDTDQRGAGFARVFGPAADIGAYEVQPAGDVIFVSGFDR